MTDEEILTAEEKELTAEQLEDLSRGNVPEAVADEELDEVSGGDADKAGPGTKLFVVDGPGCTGYNLPSVLGMPLVYLKRGTYLRDCRLVKVAGSKVDWVNYFATGPSRKGPWTDQTGWTERINCCLLAK